MQQMTLALVMPETKKTKDAKVVAALALLVECKPMTPIGAVAVTRLSLKRCVAQYMAPDASQTRGVLTRPMSCVGCVDGAKRAFAAGLLVSCECPCCAGKGRVLRDVVPLVGVGKAQP